MSALQNAIGTATDEAEAIEDGADTWRRLLAVDDRIHDHTLAQLAYASAMPEDLRSTAWFIKSGARDLLAKNADVYTYLCNEQPPSHCAKQIARDIPRTFRSDMQRRRLGQPLCRILNAYAVLNPSVLYVQGMNFIAAFILRQFFARPPTTADLTDSA